MQRCVYLLGCPLAAAQHGIKPRVIPERHTLGAPFPYGACSGTHHLRQLCRAAKGGDQVCRVCHGATLCQKKYRSQAIKYLDARFFIRIVPPCPALVPMAKRGKPDD
jgi:hypothetical protein